MLLDRLAERAALARLLEAARSGQSGVLVVRGEPGVGKTALLENAIESAAGLSIARVAGVESEMELAFAALQHLCAPMLDRMERLPGPQRDALGAAFGLRTGNAPDRFLVGLAALSLLSEVAGALEAERLVGAGVDRVDGPRKVAGSAPYPNDVSLPDMAHAALVRSTIAAGRIRGISTGPAEAAPGVLGVITHCNAPKLERGPGRSLAPPLQDNRIVHHGQYVGMVVAGTPEQAAMAARLVEVDYVTTEPVLDLDDPRAELIANRGDGTGSAAT